LIVITSYAGAVAWALAAAGAPAVCAEAIEIAEMQARVARRRYFVRTDYPLDTARVALL
jgi:hypothetical protein